jgi:hypothetical protein
MPGIAPAYDLYGSQTRVDLDRVAWVRLDHEFAMRFPALGDKLFYFKYLCVDRTPGRADRWFLCGNFVRDRRQLFLEESNGEDVRHREYVQRSEEEIAAIALRDGKAPEKLPGSVSLLMRGVAPEAGDAKPVWDPTNLTLSFKGIVCRKYARRDSGGQIEFIATCERNEWKNRSCPTETCGTSFCRCKS